MAEQPKEYYEKKPGYIIKSGTEIELTGEITDYAMFTDNGQGFQYTTDGQYRQVCHKTSYELCGSDNKSSDEPAKVIRGQKGDIIIEAVEGDLILRGKNIRIVALDGVGEVTVVSGKHFAVNAPVQSFKGSNSNTVMSNSASVGAQATDTTGNMQNSQTSGAEETEGSVLTRLLNIAKKFQQFLE